MNLFHKLTTLLTDPIFWVTTIFCGLLLGVFANYLTRWSDRLLARISTRRQAKAQAIDASIHEAADRLLRYPADRFDVKLDVLFYGARQIRWGVGTAVAFSLGTLFLTLQGLPRSLALICALICMVSGLWAWIMVGVYTIRETRALRVITAYEELKKIKESSDQIPRSLSSPAFNDENAVTTGFSNSPVDRRKSDG